MIPKRGWLVLEQAYKTAQENGCPLIMSVGNTVPGRKRTEAEIYRDGARE